MHYTLTPQTTNSFQESSVSHCAGVKNDNINLEVKGWKRSQKKPRKQHLLVYSHAKDG